MWVPGRTGIVKMGLNKSIGQYVSERWCQKPMLTQTPQRIFIEQTVQIINLLVLSNLYPDSRDIELVGLGTVCSCEKYGLRTHFKLLVRF